MEQYMTEETLKRIMDLESESNNWRESYAEAMRGWKEAQATADRRLALLRKMPEFEWDDEQETYFCPVCGHNGNYGHLRSCELAKELADEKGVE